MSSTARLLIVAFLLFNGACESSSPSAPRAAARARSAPEVVSGAGRMTGGTMTLDVQVGHAVEQRPTTQANATLSGGAAVRQ
jgi:hypothetical protein